ncbi:hypothetical protein AMQ84_04640 [Paenibacillus riograndensis]|uniref:aconitate hydratase n=1 Tax=Paenibacillus riograndensis TaxID=483937 RepID=A0A132U9I3_9BACL|nr:aconitate hydratase [Paenibacillus riograndensis]KWX80170.1 hypothetical protein AMQ84_04640 [Paenibacillus riograndensis]
MNITKKIISNYLVSGNLEIGEEISINIDQAYVEDHSGVQVMKHLEFMGTSRISCKLAVCYIDHNILPKPDDMQNHIYLQQACQKYGMWYSKSASGICHQLHVENFAVPGVTILGANSHTAHCGGIGALSIGVGGIDLAAALAGYPYYFCIPEIINVKLTGMLNDWCSAKDVSLELLRRLTVKGGVGKIFEFTGPGIKTLNVQQRMTISHMCVEVGAITGIFPSDEVTYDYFKRIKREDEWKELLPDPWSDYDGEINIDLSLIEPLIALPGQPDQVVPVNQLKNIKVHQVMVGSCTSGSYMDISMVSKVIKGHRVHPEVSFFIQPSSKMVLELLAEDGMLSDLFQAGVEVTPPSCDACVGIGYVPAPGINSLRAVSRNFKGRSGCRDDSIYLCSAETAVVSAITGIITDPRDYIYQNESLNIIEDIPYFVSRRLNTGLISPPIIKEKKVTESSMTTSEKTMTLENNLVAEVMIKLGDSISTDQIIPNGLDIAAHRSDIPKLSNYMFFRTDQTFVDRIKKNGSGFIVAGENFGQGSARENAVIVPGYLGIKVVLAKSFARTYFNNMINFSLIPLLFSNKSDFEDIEQGDYLEITNVLKNIETGRFIVTNKTKNRVYEAQHLLSEQQKKILAGGGLLAICRENRLK